MNRTGTLRLLLLLPAAFLLLHCGNSSGTSGTTSGTGGTGGSAAAGTFACASPGTPAARCKLDVELCKVQDSAAVTTWTCVPIPAACTSDVCSCATLAPGCDLGDGPGAFTCSEVSPGAYSVSCPG